METLPKKSTVWREKRRDTPSSPKQPPSSAPTASRNPKTPAAPAPALGRRRSFDSKLAPPPNSPADGKSSPSLGRRMSFDGKRPPLHKPTPSPPAPRTFRSLSIPSAPSSSSMNVSRPSPQVGKPRTARKKAGPAGNKNDVADREVVAMAIPTAGAGNEGFTEDVSIDEETAGIVDKGIAESEILPVSENSTDRPTLPVSTASAASPTEFDEAEGEVGEENGVEENNDCSNKDVGDEVCPPEIPPENPGKTVPEGAAAVEEAEGEEKPDEDGELDEETKREDRAAENPISGEIRTAAGSGRSSRESPAYNDVIEETANKLLEKRKNRVRALVGAFETVISLQEPEVEPRPE